MTRCPAQISESFRLLLWVKMDHHASHHCGFPIAIYFLDFADCLEGRVKLMYRLALFHSIFYFFSGLWPIVHMPSFLFVTGPKTDLWLVKTVGWMIVATSIVIFYAWLKKEINRPIALLAILNALFLAGVDVYYNLTDVIPPIYLLDAVAEAGLIIAWILFFPKKAT